jgi:hypothetical protein
MPRLCVTAEFTSSSYCGVVGRSATSTSVVGANSGAVACLARCKPDVEG